jgi:hypothetical protein
VLNFIALFAFAPPPAVAADLTDSLVVIERNAWEAWKSKNTAFYTSTLIPESIYLSGYGVSTHEETVAQVTQLQCTVHGFEIQKPKAMRLTADVAILTAYVTAKYTCKDQEINAADWVSTVFVKRDGGWRIAFHQETKAAK